MCWKNVNGKSMLKNHKLGARHCKLRPLGYREPDRLEYTLSTLLSEVMEEKKLSPTQTIIQHDEGVDLIPANIELSALEINLVNANLKKRAYA